MKKMNEMFAEMKEQFTEKMKLIDEINETVKNLKANWENILKFKTFK